MTPESDVKNASTGEGGATAGAYMPGPWCAASLVVLALGILATGLFIWMERLDERQRMNHNLTKALMALQIKAATSHVWLEEALAEKDEGHMVRAFSTLDWAIKLSQMITNGGVPVRGMELPHLEDAGLRKQVEDVTRLLQELRNVAQERRRNPESAGPGSPLDQRFDELHYALQWSASALEKNIETRQLADHKKVGRLFLGILLAWLAIVGAATAGIWNGEWRRRAANAALVTANERLLSQTEELMAHREHLAELVEARTVELTTVNERLRSEIAGHEQTESALQASEKQLRQLSARLMTAQEEERRRIASELHDELGHALTLVKLRLRSIERGLPDNGAFKGDSEELIGYVDQAIERIRRLSHDLSPTILHDLGLSEAMQRLVDNFCRNFDCVVTPDMADIGGLFPADAQIMIYRVMQEALTNIGKHSQAKKVSLAVLRDADRVSFVIEDDGRGFNLPGTSLKAGGRKGLGLATMEERVLMLGGTFEVRSQEGKGTRIAFSIPIPEVTP